MDLFAPPRFVVQRRAPSSRLPQNEFPRMPHILGCFRRSTGALAAGFLVVLSASQVFGASFDVSPAEVTLDRPESTQQLLVSVQAPDGRMVDITRSAKYDHFITTIAVEIGRSERANRRTNIPLPHRSPSQLGRIAPQ